MNGQETQYHHQGFRADVIIDLVAKEYEYKLYDKSEQLIKSAKGIFKYEDDVYANIKDVIADVQKFPMNYYQS